MARSLTIQHEEHASTSPLLTGFLLLAAAWMLMSAMFSGDAEATVPALDAPAAAVVAPAAAISLE